MTKQEKLLERVNKAWDDPTYDDLLELVSEFVRAMEA